MLDITGYTTDDAVKLIRGAEGTEVKITVQKPDGTLKTVSMIRAELKLDETFARSVIINSGKHKIGLRAVWAMNIERFCRHVGWALW